MAEPERSPATSPANNSMLTVRIHGKIDKVERYDGENGPIFTSLIIIPAPDTMTSPTKMQVKSVRQFGKPEEIIDIKARVSTRYWKSKDQKKVNYTPELWLAD
jgi:hypothetical protein